MVEKRISVEQYQALMDAIRALADAGQLAVDRLKNDGLVGVQASNYPTALKGFDYLAKFVEGTAGTASTEVSRSLLQPILEELRQVAEDKAKYDAKRRRNKDEA